MNSVKLFFCDVETTGLDPVKNGLTQIAGEIGYLSVEGGYETKTAFNYAVRPFPADEIAQSALDVQKKTREEIEAHPPGKEVYGKLKGILEKHVSKYDPKDKLLFVGYNSPFDISFLRSFWTKCGDQYFGSLVWWPDVCVARLAAEKLKFDRDRFPNFKLETLARELGVLGEAEAKTLHDASTDIRLTRDIYLKLIQITNPA